MTVRIIKAYIFILTAIAGFTPTGLFAADWQKWEDCTLKENEYHDGDSFYIRRGPRSYYIIRLYMVDCPETDTRHKERNEEQAEYFECDVKYIKRYGRKATKFTVDELKEGFTVYTRKEKAGGSSQKPRYFGFIEYDDGKWLGEELLKAGLARSYGMPSERPDGVGKSRLHMRLNKLERDAKNQLVGIWGADRDEDPFYARALERREKVQELVGTVQTVSRSTPVYSVFNPSQRVGLLKRGTKLYIKHQEREGYFRVRFKTDENHITEALCRLQDLLEL